MNEENVAIRLKGFMDYLGISSSQFADQCGIPRPSLSQLLNGRNKKISDVLVGQIHSAYPELSVLWLMFGEGSMLVKSQEPAKAAESPHNEDELSQSVNRPYDGSKVETEYLNGYRKEISNSQFGDLIAERDHTIKELRKEIESLKKQPRRVAQITVYYDDSTFETFFPGGSMVKGR
ncbi:MAG: hypothetical protein K2H96_03105 [Muribaculaceae bacterium]|nr:hypothetical protein [Muribaculaceae bacterium]